jgi:hypothetical protein
MVNVRVDQEQVGDLERVDPDQMVRLFLYKEIDRPCPDRI